MKLFPLIAIFIILSCNNGDKKQLYRIDVLKHGYKEGGGTFYHDCEKINDSTYRSIQGKDTFYIHIWEQEKEDTTTKGRMYIISSGIDTQVYRQWDGSAYSDTSGSHPGWGTGFGWGLTHEQLERMNKKYGKRKGIGSKYTEHPWYQKDTVSSIGIKKLDIDFKPPIVYSGKGEPIKIYLDGKLMDSFFGSTKRPPLDDGNLHVDTTPVVGTFKALPIKNNIIYEYPKYSNWSGSIKGWGVYFFTNNGTNYIRFRPDYSKEDYFTINVNALTAKINDGLMFSDTTRYAQDTTMFKMQYTEQKTIK